MSGSTTHIALRGVRVYGRHGAEADEREHPQPFDVDVELDVDADAARSSDQLADTIDYAALYRRVVDIVTQSSFVLLERLGQAIVDEAMNDVRVRSARVTIAKPQRLAGATPAVTLYAARE